MLRLAICMNRSPNNRNVRPEVIVVDGVTGSGKSEILGYVREHPSQEYIVPQKLTTRPRRLSDNSWEFNFVENIPDTPSFIEWGSVGARYAVALNDLRRTVAQGKIAVFICTEASTISLLASEFKIIHLYLYRPIEKRDLMQLLAQRGLGSEQIRTRIAEHASLQDDYLAKISTLSATLLNIGAISYLRRQFDELMSPDLAVSLST
jgi:guanylate kinase